MLFRSHLFAAYVLVWRCARALGAPPDSAALAALAVPLSGAILVMGRGWHSVVPTVVWTPALILAVLRLRHPVGPGWAVGTGLLAGIAYHVGFAQLWVYNVGTALLFGVLLVAFGHIPTRRALWAIPGGLFALALAIPLVVTQRAASEGLFYTGGYGNGVEAGQIGRAHV